MPEGLALAKNIIGCDIIDISQEKDVVGAIYKMELEGVDCAIDAAAFRYTKGILQTIERAIDLETDSSEVVNEALRAARKSRVSHLWPTMPRSQINSSSGL